MNRVTSHLPITHKDVRSTTSKTVVWKELNASLRTDDDRLAAIETLSGAFPAPAGLRPIQDRPLRGSHRIHSRLPLATRFGTIRWTADVILVSPCSAYPDAASLSCRSSFRIVSYHDAHLL